MAFVPFAAVYVHECAYIDPDTNVYSFFNVLVQSAEVGSDVHYSAIKRLNAGQPDNTKSSSSCVVPNRFFSFAV